MTAGHCLRRDMNALKHICPQQIKAQRVARQNCVPNATNPVPTSRATALMTSAPFLAIDIGKCARRHFRQYRRQQRQADERADLRERQVKAAIVERLDVRCKP